VPVLLERPGCETLVPRAELPPPAVAGEQLVVGEGGLRVVVSQAIPRVAGDGVQVPPVLLDVLPVVGLGAGQAEHPLLEDGVASVPQRQAQAEPLLHVAEAGHAVLTPPVGARPRVVVREVGPGVAVGAVVLPHRAPLALAHVRTPQVPVAGLAQPLLQPPEPLDPLPLGVRHRRSIPSQARLDGAIRMAPGRTLLRKLSSSSRGLRWAGAFALATTLPRP